MLYIGCIIEKDWVCKETAGSLKARVIYGQVVIYNPSFRESCRVSAETGTGITHPVVWMKSNHTDGELATTSPHKDEEKMLREKFMSLVCLESVLKLIGIIANI
jgi:hypothetical protein